MNTSKMINIVFYNYFEGNEEKRSATIFYRDGSVENVSYEDGITACEDLAKELNIVSKNAFSEMINNKIVHVMTAEQFKKDFNNFVNKEVIDKDTIDSAIEEKLTNNEEEVEEEFVDEEDRKIAEYSEPEADDEIEEEFVDEFEEPTSEEEIDAKEDFDDEFAEDFDDSFDYDIEDDFEVEKKKESKIGGFFKKQFNKFKNAGSRIKMTAVGLAVVLGLGGAGLALNKQSKAGEMHSKTITSGDINDIDKADPLLKRTREEHLRKVEEEKENTVTNSNTNNNNNNDKDSYDSYTTDQLLEATNNNVQKRAMTNLIKTIKGFNGKFASAYKEDDKDIKAALSFDEVAALQQAYNEYTKDEIKAIFNGAEVRADEMTKDYKSASLQLMAAYTIENSENPVDMSALIESSEGKDFYNRYHKLFLAAKETEGQEKLDNVKAFYEAVKADFPITKEVRTEGIAHSESYDSIKAYKLSVTPMIAAAEMIFQNLDVDYTLDDSEVDFINDIGLCNYADDTFERVETITLSSTTDNTNPLYSQYREATIKELTDSNQYNIDDAHRELSMLDRFQEIVNGEFEISDGDVYYTGGEKSGKTTTSTKKKTKKWKTKTASTRTKTTKEKKEIPDDEKAKIDKQIEDENKDAKEKAEAEAEKTRQQMQDEADKNAENIKKEIEEEEKDMQDKVDNANDKIDNGDTVNEKDFDDHNVKFDDDKKDSNGNLDNSVKNITTDKSDDKTNDKLPDPNETGEIFDSKMDTKQAPATENNSSQSQVQFRDVTPASTETSESKSSKVEYVSEDAYVEYPDNYIQFDENGNPYEESIDAYIESMTNSSSDDKGYQYTR